MLAAMNPNPRMLRAHQPDRAERRPGRRAAVRALGITRDEHGRWALSSHQRAIAARERPLRDEIVPRRGPRRRRRRRRIDRSTTRARAPTRRYEKIAALQPIYRADGRITAAASSGQADGAAVCLLMSRPRRQRAAASRRWRASTRIATGACDPTDLIYSAIPATHSALERSGLRMRDMAVDRDQRGVRLRAARAHARVRVRRATRRDQPRTAARARSAIRSARRARGSSARRRSSSAGAAAATASRRSAAAWARAPRRSSSESDGASWTSSRSSAPSARSAAFVPTRSPTRSSRASSRPRRTRRRRAAPSRGASSSSATPARRAGSPTPLPAGLGGRAALTAAADADRDVKDAPHYARMMRGADALARGLGTCPCSSSAASTTRASGRSPTALAGSARPARPTRRSCPRCRTCSSPRAPSGSGTTLTTLHRALRAGAARPARACRESIEPVVLVPLGFPRRSLRPDAPAPGRGGRPPRPLGHAASPRPA